MSKRITRRRFLQASAAAATGLVLESCGVSSTPPSVVNPTVTPQPDVPSMPTPTVSRAAASSVTPTADSSSAHLGYSIFEGTMVDLTWPQVEKAAKEGAIILLPTAVIEEHGPHMGLGIDTYEAYLACKITRRELELRGIQALIAPPLYWGINVSTKAFPGSFSTRPETFKALLYDVFDSLQRWGFTRVFVLNVHGDLSHNIALVQGIEEARQTLHIKAYVLVARSRAMQFQLSERVGVLIPRDPSTQPSLSKSPDVHAGAMEVGIMAHYFPGLVDTYTAKTLQPTISFQPLGYWGDPASFDPEESSAYFESGGQANAETIAQLLREEPSTSGK